MSTRFWSQGFVGSAAAGEPAGSAFRRAATTVVPGGYALLRLLPWIRQQKFNLYYWAFTFGVMALASAPMRMVARGDTGATAALSHYLSGSANIMVGLIALATLHLMLQGRLLPQAARK